VTRAHKIANLIGVPLPVVGLVAAILLLWNRGIGPLELSLLIGLYLLTASG
jgi:stearoyl-CoA desaturase (Delta-9 desaturase)